jgi:hypothetical protein
MHCHVSPAALDDYRWLTSPAAEPWLAEAAALDGRPVAQAARLRKALPPARAGLVLAQISLRRRAREKFSAAERMFFTPQGLEQATDEIVAAHKARRFAPAARVLDLCSGIGGDLAALAREHEATGLDRDPISALIAEANVRALVNDSRLGKVFVADAADARVCDRDAWHIDPDRRPRGRRTTRAWLHDPPPETIDRLLAQNPHAAVKLAPAAVWPEHWTARAEFEWISRARSCRQLVAWFGNLAQDPGQRRATLLGSKDGPARTLVGLPHQEVPPAARIDRYLFEPDPVVLAAKLEGTLAGEHALAAISPGIAYFTGPRAIADAALAAFEVDEVLPFDLKRLRAHLRLRGIGRLEIKTRAVTKDPAALRKRLAPRGDHSATLILTRRPNGVIAILARRVVGDQWFVGGAMLTLA